MRSYSYNTIEPTISLNLFKILTHKRISKTLNVNTRPLFCHNLTNFIEVSFKKSITLLLQAIDNSSEFSLTFKLRSLKIFKKNCFVKSIHNPEVF